MNKRNCTRIGLLLAALATLLTSSVTSAQRTIAHDTLSDTTPSAIQCGFCAQERYGVIFRELPAPARGLDPADFPLILRSVDVAVANARSVGGMCVSSTGTREELIHLRVFAGSTPPSGEISALPVDEPWPGESLVYDNSATPVQLSSSESDTSDDYDVNFNRLIILSETSEPLRIESPNTYLRVEVTLGEGEASMSDGCSLPSAPPNAMPLLDRDGTITPERNYIYAQGAGYLWNRSRFFDIMGDWALRLQVESLGSTPEPGDAGPMDAGTAMDASFSMDADIPGAQDGGGPEPMLEAGPTPRDTARSGCGVFAPLPSRSRPSALVFGIGMLLVLRRRL